MVDEYEETAGVAGGVGQHSTVGRLHDEPEAELSTADRLKKSLDDMELLMLRGDGTSAAKSEGEKKREFRNQVKTTIAKYISDGK